MSSLRRRAALKRLVNPNQSSQSNQSNQSSRNDRNIDLLFYLHCRFFLQKLAHRGNSRAETDKKAIERREALIKVLQGFQDSEDNKLEGKGNDNKLDLWASGTFPYPVTLKEKDKLDLRSSGALPYPVSLKRKGKDNKLDLRASSTLPYPVSSEGKGNDIKLDLQSSGTLTYPVSLKGKGKERLS